MGEARRRLLALRQQPCRCGSGRGAGTCCLQGSHWFKPPAVVTLHTPCTGKSVEKCYMRELRACDGGISGEHLISESVIRLLAGDGQFTIGGTPWLPEGESKAVGPKSLTANCLCERHNRALSPLDEAARYLFAALKSSLEKVPDASNYIASGHDLERLHSLPVGIARAATNLGRWQPSPWGHDPRFSTGYRRLIRSRMVISCLPGSRRRRRTAQEWPIARTPLSSIAHEQALMPDGSPPPGRTG
jgi:hypothetical protein